MSEAPGQISGRGVALALWALVSLSCSKHATNPEIVVIHDGQVALHAMLWRPEGPGPFPAVLFNHGSGRTKEELGRLGPYENQAEVIGPVFARHGYLFLFLFRPGVGLSADQGASAIDLMSTSRDVAERNAVQLSLLEQRELSAATAGLKFLRERSDVDPRRLAVVGHSFGGSLTLLQAEREPDARAIVIFSGSGYSWDRSPELRTRLLSALERVRAPVLFLHAANDFSVNPGKALDARLAELGKPHQLQLYPPLGQTPEEGHGLPFLGVNVWEADVFAFLDKWMR